MLFGRKSETGSEPTSHRPSEAPSTPESPPPTPETPAAASHTPDGNRAAGGSQNQSFIDASLTVMGDLHSDGDVHLDGRVCGNVSCAQLIVGKDAAISGNVTAEQVVIRGTTSGSIHARVVILQDSARVESDIVYSVLAIDDGARFDGTARRSSNPREEPLHASGVEQLQRIVLAADPARAANGGDAARGDAANAGNGKADADGHALEPEHRKSSAA